MFLFVNSACLLVPEMAYLPLFRDVGNGLLSVSSKTQVVFIFSHEKSLDKSFVRTRNRAIHAKIHAKNAQISFSYKTLVGFWTFRPLFLPLESPQGSKDPRYLETA
jgi:hypothetical protein